MQGSGRQEPELTQGGGAWQLVLPVQRGGLRSARLGTRTASRVARRPFGRTKDGSPGCSLSRDSNIGTQENSKTPLLLRILGWWILWPHRRTGKDSIPPIPSSIWPAARPHSPSECNHPPPPGGGRVVTSGSGEPSHFEVHTGSISKIRRNSDGRQ